MSYRGFHSEDEYHDALMEARREEYEDKLDRVGVECADCGTRYDPGYHPATRSEPAWAERDSCPNPTCGSEATVGEMAGTR